MTVINPGLMTLINDTLSIPMHPVSPPRCGVCAAHSRVAAPHPAPWGCHTPCPDTSAAVPVSSGWALDHDNFQRQPQQLGVVDVGHHHHHAQRPSVGLYQDAALGPRLSQVGGVPANGIPPNGPCPLPRRPTTIPSPPRPVRCNGPECVPKSGGTTQPAPTAGKSGGWCCRLPVPGADDSTGSPSAAGRLFR